MEQMFVEVGRIKEIYRYPVKSMQGEALAAVHVYGYGLDGDRRAAFVRGDANHSFPWLTGREVAQMVRYTPSYTQPEDVLRSPIDVCTPNGRYLALESDELRAELTAAYGHQVSLLQSHRGLFDTLPLSLMSLTTAQALDELAQRSPLGQRGPLDKNRFRQNIIMETFSQIPYQEESWLGGLLLIGDPVDGVQIRLNQRIKRCAMITINPTTAQREPEVLKMVAQQRQNCVGVAGSPEKTGMIKVGDMVRLVKP